MQVPWPVRNGRIACGQPRRPDCRHLELHRDAVPRPDIRTRLLGRVPGRRTPRPLADRGRAIGLGCLPRSYRQGPSGRRNTDEGSPSRPARPDRGASGGGRSGLWLPISVLPDFHGTRSPISNPLLTGAISGLDLDRSLDGLLRLYWRSCVSLACSIRNILDHLPVEAGNPQALFLAGGLADHPLLSQLYADATAA